LWPVLAGEPWCRKSRALFIDHEQNLVVAVADASTGQELSLLKPQLIKQVNAASKSLGISVRGMRLDLKHFHSKPVPEQDFIGEAGRLPEPTQAELDGIELSAQEMADVEALRQELGEDKKSPVSGKRIADLFEKELRLRTWRRAHGYPICTACSIPTAILHGPDRICMVCFYAITP
jgi:hypothetical protein